MQPYYFHKNLQGDVVAIYDASGNIKAEYAYDAYGNCKVTDSTLSDLALNNPIRYRSYYYDRETKLYYLNTRYYSPELRRFISPDSTDYLDPESVNGLNLYVYCGNDPVNYVDPSGHSAILIGLIIGAIIGAAIGFGTVAYSDYQDDGQIFNGSVQWYDYLGATVLGGVIGAGIGAGAGYIAPQIGGALSAFAAKEFTFGAGAYITACGELAMSAGLTITGAQILQGAKLVVGSFILMSQIGKSGGYRIDHHYPNDHEPPHVHISGDDGTTKVDIKGNPIQGKRPMTPGERKAFKNLLDKIYRELRKWFPNI